MSTPDNPPAFPLHSDGQFAGTTQGMTLRDYFAAKAVDSDVDEILPTTCGESAALYHKLGFGPKPESQESIAYLARYPVHIKLRAWAKYQYADAMLAQRARHTQGGMS